MKVASKTEYALNTVLDLAVHGNGRVVSAAEIARRRRIPLKYLEQILSLLREGGLVTSRRGARGGYELAKPPDDISLEEVVRLSGDGLLSPEWTDEGRAGTEDGPFDLVWREFEHFIRDRLRNISIEDIAKHERAATRDASHYVI